MQQARRRRRAEPGQPAAGMQWPDIQLMRGTMCAQEFSALCVVWQVCAALVEGQIGRRVPHLCAHACAAALALYTTVVRQPRRCAAACGDRL